MKRRISGSLLISIAVHIVFGAALLWVLSIPAPFNQWLKQYRGAPIPVERIGFLQLPNRGTNVPGRSGGNGRPVTRHRGPAAPLTAPTTVPTGIPQPVPGAAGAPEAGSGPVVGRGGAEQGIVPSFSDPRLWLPPGPVVTAPKTPSQRLDSAIVARLQVHLDSMQAIAANAGRAPGDWTFEKNGKKYGIDSKKIYIGDHTLPTAILALLPLNSGGNPILAQQDKALAFQRAEIMENAQRAMNEEEFREAVKRIRERKQREHDAELKAREERRKKAAQADSIIAQP